MNYSSAKVYEKELNALIAETTQTSEQLLREQEQKIESTLNEIIQSVKSMAQENDLVQITSDSMDDLGNNTMINLEDFQKNIQSSTKLLEILKLTHLEQDALDYFLRYTITSSTTLLELQSIQDPKFVKLQKEVTSLEKGQIQNHLDEIDRIKSDINKLNGKISTSTNQLNQLHLDTTNDIDDCFTLLKNLDNLENVQLNQQKTNLKNDPIMETYNAWQSYNKDIQRLNDLKEEEKQYGKSLKRATELTNNRSQSNVSANSSSNLAEEMKVINALNKLLFSSLTNNISKDITNFLINPDDKSIQFAVSNFQIRVNLTESNNILKINVSRLNGATDLACQKLTKKLGEKYLRNDSLSSNNNPLVIFAFIDDVVKDTESL